VPEGVEVPPDALIGVEGQGLKQALVTLPNSRTLAAGISLGIARAAFDEAFQQSAPGVPSAANLVAGQLATKVAGMAVHVCGARGTQETSPFRRQFPRREGLTRSRAGPRDP
jgi:alkylation response protein AidB-like acyl-CoA dehydrogenase